jgi:hypothetical protein
MMPVPCCCGGGEGYKIVHAKRYWYGRGGFTDDCDGFEYTTESPPCGCVREDLHTSPPTVKYLNESRELTYHQVFTQDLGLETEYTLTDDFHWKRAVSQDRYSGEIYLTDCLKDLSAELMPIPGSGPTASYARMVNFFHWNPRCGYYVEEDVLSGVAPVDADSFDIAIFEVTDDSITISCSWNEETPTSTLVGTLTLTVTLSETMTSAEVLADVKTLLAAWSLADDLHYPWRTTSSPAGSTNTCVYGPCVTYDAGYDAIGSYMAGWDPYYAGDCPDPEDYPVLLTDGTHTGEVIGGPDLDDDDPWTTAGGPAMYGLFTGGNLVFANDWKTTTGDSGDALAPGFLYATKWAETKVDLPSHNFARPCGDDAETLFSEPCICPEDEPGCPNTPEFPSVGPCDPEDPCNSEETTDTFTIREWQYDWRTYQEVHRVRVQDLLCAETEGCTEYTPPAEICEDESDNGGYACWIDSATCSEGVKPYGTALWISPNGESFTFANQGYDWNDTGFVCDGRYGSQWTKKIYQYEVDPFWKPGCIEWPADSDEWISNPSELPTEADMVESRCEQPDGCDPLPDGYYMGCMSPCYPEAYPCPPVWLYGA